MMGLVVWGSGLHVGFRVQDFCVWGLGSRVGHDRGFGL